MIALIIFISAKLVINDEMEESDKKLESLSNSTDVNINDGKYNEDEQADDKALLDNHQDIKEEISDNSIEWSLFTDDIEKGWDGIKNGRKMQIGEYSYFINIVDDLGKYHTFKGNVILN